MVCHIVQDYRKHTKETLPYTHHCILSMRDSFGRWNLLYSRRESVLSSAAWTKVADTLMQYAYQRDDLMQLLNVALQPHRTDINSSYYDNLCQFFSTSNRGMDVYVRIKLFERS